MNDFSKLIAEVANLSAKVDAYLARPAAAPVDVQPDIDSLTIQVQRIAGKIPD